MTDTVKLIIEIPKEKELIDKAIWNDVSDFDTEDLAIILTALKNGVPLDDVKALEQEPCEDCISRTQAIKAMDELENEDIEAYGCSIPEGFDGERARQAICLLPSVQPVACIGKVEFDEEKLKDIVHETIENYSRPKGEWIEDECGTIICSRCKKPRRDCRFDHIGFCNSCGADMRGE